MLEQWRDAAAKDAPAVLAADRALAMASEQFRLYRDEFLVLALGDRRRPARPRREAVRRAAKIDPNARRRPGLKSLAPRSERRTDARKVKMQLGGGRERRRADLQERQDAGGHPPAGVPAVAAKAANRGAAERPRGSGTRRARRSRGESAVLVDETHPPLRQLLRDRPGRRLRRPEAAAGDDPRHSTS